MKQSKLQIQNQYKRCKSSELSRVEKAAVNAAARTVRPIINSIGSDKEYVLHIAKVVIKTALKSVEGQYEGLKENATLHRKKKNGRSQGNIITRIKHRKEDAKRLDYLSRQAYTTSLQEAKNCKNKNISAILIPREIQKIIEDEMSSLGNTLSVSAKPRVSPPKIDSELISICDSFQSSLGETLPRKNEGNTSATQPILSSLTENPFQSAVDAEERDALSRESSARTNPAEGRESSPDGRNEDVNDSSLRDTGVREVPEEKIGPLSNTIPSSEGRNENVIDLPSRGTGGQPIPEEKKGRLSKTAEGRSKAINLNSTLPNKETEEKPTNAVTEKSRLASVKENNNSVFAHTSRKTDTDVSGLDEKHDHVSGDSKLSSSKFHRGDASTGESMTLDDYFLRVTSSSESNIFGNGGPQGRYTPLKECDDSASRVSSMPSIKEHGEYSVKSTLNSICETTLKLDLAAKHPLPPQKRLSPDTKTSSNRRLSSERRSCPTRRPNKDALLTGSDRRTSRRYHELESDSLTDSTAAHLEQWGSMRSMSFGSSKADEEQWVVDSKDRSVTSSDGSYSLHASSRSSESRATNRKIPVVHTVSVSDGSSENCIETPGGSFSLASTSSDNSSEPLRLYESDDESVEVVSASNYSKEVTWTPDVFKRMERRHKY
mmetsp:Transcript_6689/g.9775  ORF Transcript_6689/g.9775 Transcript_6689/m.9775 type:complete len:660 (-) Transcript_6689:176-2155(-)